MSIILRPFTAADSEPWDSFVLQSNNGTLFHLRRFLGYHIDRSFDDHSLIAEKKGKILAIFPAALVHENEKKTLHSHPGATFGGWVYNVLSYIDSTALTELLIAHCKSINIDTIFIIPTPQSYYRYKCETLSYTMQWQGFEIEEKYISSIIDLNQYTYIKDFLHRRKRRYIKTIELNTHIRTEWCPDFDGFYPILLENKKRHGSRPTHSQAELTELYKLMPDRFYLFMMYYNNTPIGGTLNFIGNSRVGIIFYNMVNYEFKHLHPATYQIYKTIEWGKKQGLDYLDFGVSQLPKAPDPLTPSPDLIRFKEQFSASGMTRVVLKKDFQ